MTADQKEDVIVAIRGARSSLDIMQDFLDEGNHGKAIDFSYQAVKFLNEAEYILTSTIRPLPSSQKSET